MQQPQRWQMSISKKTHLDSASGHSVRPARSRPGQGGRPRLPVQTAVSAGGIVWRPGSQGLEVVICGRDSDSVWGLPKGTPNPGESVEETAAREVSEESGLEVRILDKVGTIEYWFARDGVRYHKWVHLYLMEATGGNTSRHDSEYDRAEWRPVDDALKTLTFRNEADMVAKARDMIEARR